MSEVQRSVRLNQAHNSGVATPLLSKSISAVPQLFHLVRYRNRSITNNEQEGVPQTHCATPRCRRRRNSTAAQARMWAIDGPSIGVRVNRLSRRCGL